MQRSALVGKQIALTVKPAISAAVCLALYGQAQPVLADEQEPAVLQEVIVTAQRRSQTLEEVPYNLSVVTADQLAATGVTDLPSLANQVPGLSFYSLGARLSGATVPIIRGLNATAAPRAVSAFRTFNQAPVGTYIDNSPIDGYFQLDDIQRVEVLRGPQGTLYGAGSLGGALRIIPNAPELGKFSGRVDASAGDLAHSGEAAYTVGGMLNVPIGDTLALRLSGKYAYEPGWINAHGILERPGDPLFAAPVLANAGDVVNSAGIVQSKNDWNDQNTFTGRASLLWKPADKFNAELAFIYANLNGDGGPVTMPFFTGGPDPIDPRTTLPAAGNYDYYTRTNEPYWRRTSLSSLDLSYDAGFATVASTSSYYSTKGFELTDDAYDLYGLAGGAVVPYYAGSPVNPRFVEPVALADSEHTFTEEMRLISNAAQGTPVNYTVGLFYEKQGRPASWTATTPGTPERAAAQGCTGLYFFGAAFPNCLVATGPNDTNFVQTDDQNFTDKSEFAEVTWHFTNDGQITFGGRHTLQDFTDVQTYYVYTFPQSVGPTTPRSTSTSKNTWKINPSYQYAKDQYVYATWSQGFRRGGANGIPLTGTYAESPLILQYGPDSVNNYEVGLKGRMQNGLSYTFAIFDIEWDKPQIAGTTPAGNQVVFNGSTARSTGFEIESTGPLFLPGFFYTIGGAYADAKLTGSYSYPANNGSGTVVPGVLTGTPGEQLPGSAKTSAAVTLTYIRDVSPGYELAISLNGTYRSAVPLALFVAGTTPLENGVYSQAYTILNLTAMLSHGPWRFGVYGTNLTDKNTALTPAILEPTHYTDATLNATETMNLPREIGVRASYAF